MATALDVLDRVAQQGPPDERWDANAEAFNALQGTLGAPGMMTEVDEQVASLLADQHLMSKAVRLQQYDRPYKVETGGAVSVLNVNEYGVVLGDSGTRGANSRWVEKPIPGGFAFLREIVHQVDLIKAIILTRQRQIEAFCRPENEQTRYGFRFVKKDGTKLEEDEQKQVRRLQSWLLNCGDEEDPVRRRLLKRETMRGFVKKFVWDTLSGDACPVELERANKGALKGMYNVPFDTIRLCTEEGYQGDDEICAVQVIDDMPYVTYSHGDLVYEIRNPRTDLAVNGYGYAEPEMVVRILTAYLNSFHYNASGLDRNSIPRGILQIYGDYQPSQLRAFQSRFSAMMNGVTNRWRLPVLAARNKEAGVNYVPMDTNYNEMYFARWTTFLVSVTCATYSIDPTEIHFESFNARAQSSMSGDDTEERLAHSLDKGLLPLLTFIEDFYNGWIIPNVDDRFRLQFAGLRPDDEQAKNDRIKLSSTVDELRAMDGKQPLEDEMLGQAPTNPALMQVYMTKLQQEMGAAEGEAGPGREEGGYPEGPEGQHEPYAETGGQGPEDDHLHTLMEQAGDMAQAQAGAEGEPQAMGKSVDVLDEVAWL